ncbi:MAG: hypothetical protein M1826_006494 [Phylliscum demangeonii]|nr:MAG: hypothetical protein M1826_006494 [Phylliscum demangeonii]
MATTAAAARKGDALPLALPIPAAAAADTASASIAERTSLLSAGRDDHDDDDDDDADMDDRADRQRAAAAGAEAAGHSPPTIIIEGPTPRSPHRVRFQLDGSPGPDVDVGVDVDVNDHRHDNDDDDDGDPPWIAAEDVLAAPRRALAANANGDEEAGMELDEAAAHRAPLLTAPRSLSGDVGDLARPKSGMRSAFMNMANSIIGAGIIGQPYAFRQAGLATGVVLLLALTVTVDWTIRLIVVNSKLSGADSFQGTVEHCFGRAGLIAISLAQWMFAFGGMVAFCIIIGDSIPHVLAALFPSLHRLPVLWLLTNRYAVIVIFVMAVSYPLSLYRDIAKLAKASTLALLSMVVILVAVITQGIRVPSDRRGHYGTSLLTMNDGVFQAIGVISFDHNSLLIYGSLQKPTLDRFARVTHLSTGISMAACLSMALAGFLTFGDQTQGNILNNFGPDNLVVNFARFCFGLNMLTTLPLEAFVCRSVLTHLFYSSSSSSPLPLRQHVLVTTALVVAAVLLSLLTCDLGAVFELVGASSAAALAYILPPLCWLKLTTARSRSWRGSLLARACVAFGGVVVVVSAAQAGRRIWSGE